MCVCVYLHDNLKAVILKLPFRCVYMCVCVCTSIISLCVVHLSDITEHPNDIIVCTPMMQCAAVLCSVWCCVMYLNDLILSCVSHLCVSCVLCVSLCVLCISSLCVLCVSHLCVSCVYLISVCLVYLISVCLVSISLCLVYLNVVCLTDICVSQCCVSY